MGKPSCTDAEFIKLFEQSGPTETATILGLALRNVQQRRQRLESKIGRPLLHPGRKDAVRDFKTHYESRIPITIENGSIVIGSDAHFWPGERTTAFRGFLSLIEKLKPTHVIMNGDVFDGAKISRHPPSGWNHIPSVKEELEAVSDRLSEIEAVSPSSKHLWTLGNHDLRFENMLAQKTPELEGVMGFSLKDHFPSWDFGMSFWCNDDLVVKHRYKGGIHATHNNTVNAGLSIVTGHLHALKVTPFADYRGNRFGVDTGTLADPTGAQFAYMEDNPANWRSGFIVLTFKDKKLLWPEVCAVIDPETIQFRGETYRV